MFEDDEETVDAIKEKFYRISCENAKDRLKDRLLDMTKLMMARHKRRFTQGGTTTDTLHVKEGELYSYEQQERFVRKPALESWLKIVRFFRSIISAYRAIRFVGYERKQCNERSVLERYTISTVMTKDPDNFGSAILASFNPRDYVTEKEQRIPLPVVLAMQKKPDMRRVEDIQVIYSVMSWLHSFQAYSNEKRMELAKYIKYFRVGSRRTLLKRGADSMLVYFLFAGQVCLVVDEGSAENEASFMSDKIITLNRGGCFGTTQRSPLCITMTDCELLVLEKEIYYEKKFDSVHVQELNERFQFFRNWPPVDNWSDNAIYDLATISFTELYPAGRTILKDVEQYSSDLVWFVLKGRMDVVRRIDKGVCEKDNTDREEIIDPRVRREKMTKFLDTAMKVVKPAPAEGTESGPCQQFLLKGLRHQSSEAKTNVSSAAKKFKSNQGQIFMKLRSLEKGECFGLESVRLKNSYQLPVGRLCLISRNCQIIRISKTQLNSLSAILGLDSEALKNATHNYFEDFEICERLEEMRAWNLSKQFLVESQVARTPTCEKLGNFSRHYQAGHGRKVKYDQPNYRSPLPLLRVGGIIMLKTQNPYWATIKSVDNKALDSQRYEKKNRCTLK